MVFFFHLFEKSCLCARCNWFLKSVYFLLILYNKIQTQTTNTVERMTEHNNFNIFPQLFVLNSVFFSKFKKKIIHLKQKMNRWLQIKFIISLKIFIFFNIFYLIVQLVKYFLLNIFYFLAAFCKSCDVSSSDKKK